MRAEKNPLLKNTLDTLIQQWVISLLKEKKNNRQFQTIIFTKDHEFL